MTTFGRHYLVDLHGCDPRIITKVGPTRERLLQAAHECGATVVSDSFHQYQPHGVSGIILIAESHLSIHTWPEEAFAALDIFTCGDEMRPQVAIDSIRESFGAATVKSIVVTRGGLEP